MAIRILYFFQEGCMACHEQEPILAEVESVLGLRAERINPLRESHISRHLGSRSRRRSSSSRMDGKSPVSRGSSTGKSSKMPSADLPGVPKHPPDSLCLCLLPGLFENPAVPDLDAGDAKPPLSESVQVADDEPCIPRDHDPE